MSLRLTDFGTFDEVKKIAYFTFAISGFENLKENKISKPFCHAGHIWKLQVRKKHEYLGMFLRWYGTKAGLDTHVRCSCVAGLGFSVLNHFDTSKTINEGNFNDDDAFDRVGLGIGYGEVAKLDLLKVTPGFIVKDKMNIKLRIQIKSTSFVDKIQATLRPDRMFVRSLKFPFHGAEWSFVLFPNGEHEEDEAEPPIDVVEEKATLYLSRDSIPDNAVLRHQAHFILFVEGGPSFEVRQNFYENQSLVFGTGYLMSSKMLRKICRNGVIRVGVKFLEMQPYFNFAYNLRNNDNQGVSFRDQRNIPWMLKLGMSEKNSENLECSLTIDPKAKCKKIKSLETRDKKFKATWHAKVINFQDSELGVDVWSEQSDDCCIYHYAGECHCIQLPVAKSQMTCDGSPYLDDDLQSSVHISILNSNFICDGDEISMKIDELREITSHQKQHMSEFAERCFIREQIWKMSLEKVEEEKEDAIAAKNEFFEKQTTELKEKDLVIHSLQEKLVVVESYVKSLETNQEEAIEKFEETSITKLTEKSSPGSETKVKMTQVFYQLEKKLKDFSTDIAKVAPVGALGQDTVTSHKLEIDALVFLTGDSEKHLKNGDANSCLNLIKDALKCEENNEKNNNGQPDAQFDDFNVESSRLRCKSADFDVNVYPTKDWFADGGYSAIYEAATGLNKEALQCFIVATSERQAEFVKGQDEQCKDLIRMVKVWRDKMEWKINCRPPSYLISLLIIKAYNTLKKHAIVKTVLFQKEVLTEVGFLLQEKDLRIEWSEYYDPDDFPIENSEAPFIRDPVLPSHNVAEFGDCSQFQSEFIAWVTELSPL